MTLCRRLFIGSLAVFLPLATVFPAGLKHSVVLRALAEDDPENSIQFEASGFRGEWAGFEAFTGHTEGILYLSGLFGHSTTIFDCSEPELVLHTSAYGVTYWVVSNPTVSFVESFETGEIFSYIPAPTEIDVTAISGEQDCGDCVGASTRSRNWARAELENEYPFTARNRRAFPVPFEPSTGWSFLSGLDRTSFHTNIHRVAWTSSRVATSCEDVTASNVYPFTFADYAWAEQTGRFRVKGCPGVYMLHYTIGKFTPTLTRSSSSGEQGDNLPSDWGGSISVTHNELLPQEPVMVTIDESGWSDFVDLPLPNEPTSEIYPTGEGFELITDVSQAAKYGATNLDTEGWLAIAPRLIPFASGCETACGGDGHGGGLPGSGTAALGSVSLNVSLGQLSDGKPAGAIGLSSPDLSGDLLDPAKLVIFSGASTAWENEVRVIRQNGVVRQIRAPGAFVDVTALSPGMRIRFYEASAGGNYDPENPIVAPSGTAHTEWEVAPGAIAPAIRIERTGRGADSTWDFVPNAGGGIAMIREGVIETYHTFAANGAVVELRTVSDTTYGLLSSTRQIWRWTNDRLKLEEDVRLDTSGNIVEGLVTSASYEYDQEYRVGTSVLYWASDWVASGTGNTYTSREYVDGTWVDASRTNSILSDLDGDGKDERLRTSRTLVDPFATNRVSHTITYSKPVTFKGEAFKKEETREPTAAIATAWNSPNQRVTVRYVHRAGQWAGRTAWEFHPDGTTVSWIYGETGEGGRTTIHQRGRFDEIEGVFVAGTRTTNVTDANGRWVSRTETDIATELDTSEEAVILRHPLLGSPTEIDRNGSVETRVYSECCGTLESVTVDGLTRTILYDDLNREVGEEIRTATGGFISGRRSELDGLNRIRKTWIRASDGSERLVESLEYDLAGRLVSRIDARGFKTEFEDKVVSGKWHRTITHPATDASYALEELTVTAGDGTPLEFHRNGLLVTKWSYESHDDGREIREIRVGNNGAETEWTDTVTNLRGQRLGVTHPDAARSEWEYDSAGRLIRQTDPDGVQHLFDSVWNEEPILIPVEGEADPNNPLAFPEITWEQIGSIWREWRVTAVDLDRDGVIDYGGDDRITRSTTTAATRAGQVVRRTITQAWTGPGADPETVSLVDVSVDGTQTWEIRHGTSTHTATSIDPSGQRTETTTFPDRTKLVRTYLGTRLMSETRKASDGEIASVETFTYDLYGRLQTSTTARGTTVFTYHLDDRLETVTTPDPGDGTQTTAYEYNARGWTVKVIHPDLTETETTYWPTGEARKVSGSRTYPVEYEYDRQGRRTKMTTWQDSGTTAETTWTYHPQRGWLTGKTYHGPTAGPTYQYWPSGRLQQRTWARGVTTDYAYNNAGDLWTVTYSDSTSDVTHTYDRMGRLQTTTDAAGQLTRAHTFAGSLKEEVYTGAGLLSGRRIDRGHDAIHRPRSLETDSGYQLHYLYDQAGRLGQINEGHHRADLGYEPGTGAHQSTTIRRVGVERARHERILDALGRVEQVKTTVAGSAAVLRNYTHNAANQRTIVEHEDGRAWHYGYDPLGQVTSAVKRLSDDPQSAVLPGYTFGYTFDDIGNRKTATRDGRTATYTPDTNLLNQYEQRTVPGYIDVLGEALPAATVTVNTDSTQRTGRDFHRQIPVDNTASPTHTSIIVEAEIDNDLIDETRWAFLLETPESFDHDADGNLKFDGRWTYTWDGENRLIAMETLPGIAATFPGLKQRLEFAYDFQGRRIQKVVKSWDTGSSTWQTTKDLRFLYDGWNLIEERDALNNGKIVRAHVWGLDLSGTMQGAGGVGGLLWTTTPTQTFAASVDANGNVVAWINTATQAIAGRIDYSPFGEPVIRTGIANELPFGFSTKYLDAETGLSYYGFRYLDHSTGRWISRDPIGEAGGLNLYGFVENNPGSRWDYLGLFLGGPGWSDSMPRPLSSPPGPSALEQFLPPFGPSNGAFVDNTAWFEHEYATEIEQYKAWAKLEITYAIIAGCVGRPTHVGPFSKGELPPGQSYFSKQFQLGNVSLIVDTATVAWAGDQFSWTATLRISDGLGFDDRGGWFETHVQYPIFGNPQLTLPSMLPGGGTVTAPLPGLFPPRSITRAKWQIEGSGECCASAEGGNP